MNLKIKESKGFIAFLSISILAILLFSFILFGITGVRVVLGVLFVSLPFYLILNNFELEEGEKFVFSILMGFALFSSLAYILGLMISFRAAIAITFTTLAGVAVALWKYKSPKK